MDTGLSKLFADLPGNAQQSPPIRPEPLATSGAIDEVGSGQASATNKHPFDVIPDDSTHIYVRPGTINGYVPDNMADRLGMLGSGTEYLIMVVDLTDGEVTAAALAVYTTPPDAMPVTAGSPPTSFDVLLAVLVAGKPYRTIGQGSLVATPYEAYRLALVMPTPDAMPYDSYYTWRLSVT